MGLTYAGKGGVPYNSELEARLSYASDSSLTTTDATRGATYSSDRDRIQADYEREKRGW